MLSAKVQYLYEDIYIACDGKCQKAWGINSRPYMYLNGPDDEDDIMWYADEDLGLAPIDPGTYEGGDCKPLSSSEFPNKWCVRECERSCRNKDNNFTNLPDWENRLFNIPDSAKKVPPFNMFRISQSHIILLQKICSDYKNQNESTISSVIFQEATALFQAGLILFNPKIAYDPVERVV